MAASSPSLPQDETLLVPWTLEEVFRDEVTRRDICEHLQRVAAPSFLAKWGLTGSVRNIIKKKKKRFLADAYLEFVTKTRVAACDLELDNENKPRTAASQRRELEFYAADNNNSDVPGVEQQQLLSRSPANLFHSIRG